MNTSATNLSTAATTVPIAGSGASGAAGADGATHAAPVAGPGSVIVALDRFARQAGPDVSMKTQDGLVRVHAVFQMDPSTRELTVSVVEEGGRLIRRIPTESVARMIAAMATSRGCRARSAEGPSTSHRSTAPRAPVPAGAEPGPSSPHAGANEPVPACADTSRRSSRPTAHPAEEPCTPQR
jgi:hypothetical protein